KCTGRAGLPAHRIGSPPNFLRLLLPCRIEGKEVRIPPGSVPGGPVRIASPARSRRRPCLHVRITNTAVPTVRREAGGISRLGSSLIVATSVRLFGSCQGPEDPQFEGELCGRRSTNPGGKAGSGARPTVGAPAIPA